MKVLCGLLLVAASVDARLPRYQRQLEDADPFDSINLANAGDGLGLSFAGQDDNQVEPAILSNEEIDMDNNDGNGDDDEVLLDDDEVVLDDDDSAENEALEPPTPTKPILTATSPADSPSCIFEVLKYKYDDVILTPSDVGESLTVELLDVNTNATIGTYLDAATFFGNDDCVYFGSFNFDYDADIYKTQFKTQGTCNGIADTIVGGTGVFGCSSGKVLFDDTISQDFGYISIYAYGSGCSQACARRRQL